MFELNLQLFAADNIAISNDRYANYFNAGSIDTTDGVNTGNVGAAYKLADGTTTVTGALSNLSAEMKEFYSQYLIKDVGPNLIHAQFLDAETLPKNHGRTIEWRKWENFSKKTTPLTEGVTPEPSKISVNPLRVSLSQYGDWTLLTDLVQLQTIDNTLVEITEKHSQNAKLTLDTITREKLIAGNGDGTKVAYAGTAVRIGDVRTTISPKDCARLTAYLRQNNAPTFDGSYVMIIHPYVAYDLMTNSDWIDVVKYSDNTKIFNGEIGKLYGIRFVESTEAKVNKAKGFSGTDTTKKYKTTVKTVTSQTALVLADNTLGSAELASGTKLIIHDVSDTTNWTTSEVSLSAASDGQSIALSAAAGFTVAAGDEVWLAENAAEGQDYFTCLVLGKGAGRRVDFNGSNAEMIVKPVGSAGATDPLNQRGSVGWKVDGYTAAVTNSNYIYKYYCCSGLTGAKAND